MDTEILIVALSNIRGVSAIALGGSRSRNEADAKSDYDIGLYYDAGDLDLIALGEALRNIDDQHREGILNPPGDWGPWINGGAWLAVDGIPVDILLRETGRVEEVLSECISGKITIDYQCGHPFGFVNTIYAAEMHYCRPMWQNEHKVLDRLKALLYSKGAYSYDMKKAVAEKFLWEARFSLDCSRKAASRGDVNYAAGSIFRAVCSWVQALYAINEVYLMNEKGSLQKITGLKRRPDAMEQRVGDVYRLILDGEAGKAYVMLNELHSEIENIA